MIIIIKSLFYSTLKVKTNATKWTECCRVLVMTMECCSSLLTEKELDSPCNDSHITQHQHNQKKGGPFHIGEEALIHEVKDCLSVPVAPDSSGGPVGLAEHLQACCPQD